MPNMLWPKHAPSEQKIQLVSQFQLTQLPLPISQSIVSIDTNSIF